MNDNPYGAPDADGPSGSPPPYDTAGGSDGDSIDAGDLVTAAWGVLQTNAMPLVVGTAVTFMGPSVVRLAPLVIVGAKAGAHDPGSTAVTALAHALSMLLSSFLGIGLVRMCLSAVRGEPVEMGTLFSGASRFLPVVGTAILQGAAIIGGFLCLIVPGLVLSLGFMLANYYCIDAELGPIDAMRESWAATKGHRIELALLWLLCGVIGLAGALACCVGLFVALPLVNLVLATAYVRLSGRMGGGGFDSLRPIDGYGAPPAGGYGGYGPPGGGHGDR